MFIPFFIVALFFSQSVAQGKLLKREDCSHNNCLRAFIRSSSEAATFCQTYTSGIPIPTFAANCGGDVAKVASACSCIYTAPTATSTSSPVVTSEISCSPQSYLYIYFSDLFFQQRRQSLHLPPLRLPAQVDLCFHGETPNLTDQF